MQLRVAASSSSARPHEEQEQGARHGYITSKVLFSDEEEFKPDNDKPQWMKVLKGLMTAQT